VLPAQLGNKQSLQQLAYGLPDPSIEAAAAAAAATAAALQAPLSRKRSSKTKHKQQQQQQQLDTGKHTLTIVCVMCHL
jgi:cytochrome c5